MPPEIQQRGAERGQVGRLRLARDRAQRPLGCVFELRGVEAHQGHQMQELRIFGVLLKRALAAYLRIEIFLRAQVGDDGIEDDGHVGGAGAGVALALCGGRPALATVHKAFSRVVVDGYL